MVHKYEALLVKSNWSNTLIIIKKLLANIIGRMLRWITTLECK